eukprot:6180579-Pleurochrysis_carterae.AAC.1
MKAPPGRAAASPRKVEARAASRLASCVFTNDCLTLQDRLSLAPISASEVAQSQLLQASSSHLITCAFSKRNFVVSSSRFSREEP